jgi:hypothetical protein
MAGMKFEALLDAQRKQMRTELMALAMATNDVIEGLRKRIVALEREVADLKAQASLRRDLQVDGLRDEVIRREDE